MKRVIIGVNIFLLILLLISLYLSGTKRNGLVHQKLELANGSSYFNIMLGDFQPFRIGLHQDGTLDYVSNYIENTEQIIYFYRSGVVQSKLKRDNDDRVQGRAYYFYDKSGNLSSDYNYVDDLKFGSAVAYHDSSDHIKQIMLYNENGELYYRKTFDWQGNLLSEEGSKY